MSAPFPAREVGVVIASDKASVVRRWGAVSGGRSATSGPRRAHKSQMNAGVTGHIGRDGTGRTGRRAPERLATEHLARDGD
jgi:hypothetical protein